MHHEVELSLLPLLCDPKRVSVDIGAAGGQFMVRLARLSSRCVAFEPRRSSARELRAMATHVGLPIQVENVALSDSQGQAHLRMLLDDPGRSTIEDVNALADENGGQIFETLVRTQRLDDYGLTGVGFIKIDVEGHEVAVLKGAVSTLDRDQPMLLIEAENRHRPNAVADLDAYLTARGYRGFFVHDRQIKRVERFISQVHQNPANIGGWKSNWKRRGVYINNFMYVPKAYAPDFVASSTAILRKETTTKRAIDSTSSESFK